MRTWLQRFSKKTIRGVFVAYFVFLFAWLVVPPMFDVINKADPWVLGMPFVLFMISVICILVCIGLVVLFEIERIKDDL